MKGGKKEMMKRILSLVILMSLVFGVLLLFNTGFVLADNQGQDINASIGENITLFINPTTVEFGPVAPGTTGTSNNITFNATGSNVNITIDVTSVTGEPFASGLMFDGALATSYFKSMDCVISGAICTYGILTIVPTLVVPVGSPAGTKTGVITYTISVAP